VSRGTKKGKYKGRVGSSGTLSGEKNYGHGGVTRVQEEGRDRKLKKNPRVIEKVEVKCDEYWKSTTLCSGRKHERKGDPL